MGKYRFSNAERYAVWLNHGKRCWLCNEPLRLHETTIDHVVPESVLEDNAKLKTIIDCYDLPSEFCVNGFENWLPCHNHCNQRKSNSTFKFVPGYKLILDRLIRDADKVSNSAAAITQNVKKDKLFAQIMAAIDKDEISLKDLESFIGDIAGGTFHPKIRPLKKSQFIQIDSGYWLVPISLITDHRILITEKSLPSRDFFARFSSRWRHPSMNTFTQLVPLRWIGSKTEKRKTFKEEKQ